MLKIFIPAYHRPLRPLPFLPGGQDLGNRLFQNIPAEDYQGIFEIAEHIKDCDVFLIPHEYALISQYPEVLEDWFKEAKTAGKPVLLSAYQDSTDMPEWEGVYILRSSAYKSKLRPRDIVMPAYVEDIGFGKNIQLVKGDTARVSFVGKAGFSSLRERLRYLFKNYVLLKGPQREGIYFRRKALSVLAKDPRIELHALVRKSFSGHKHTVEVPPAQARKEYIDTILVADFNLAPRGDGNYSLRFFETLALGRIPIFIDTDAPLPLEDIISYDEFIIRVPHDDLESIPDRVCAFFEGKSAVELDEVTKKARDMFERYLYIPKFLCIALTPERFSKK